MAYAESEKEPAPEGRARKGEGKMTERDLCALMENMIGDAATYIDTELGPARAKATRYYNGEPFGNEEDGRSKVVMTEVHDQIQSILPSLLRVLFSADRVVEFVPRNPKGEAVCRVATDFISHDFRENNAGFLQTHAVLKDGLTRKLGIFKWGWNDTPRVQTYSVRNVTESELTVLLSEDDVGLDSVEVVSEARPAAGLEPGAEAVYNAEFTRTDREGRAEVFAVPTDEFLYSREARTVEDALVVAHRTEKTVGELVAMGYSKKVIEEHMGEDNALEINEEKQARAESPAGIQRDPEAGEANRKVTYVEAYPMIDFNGDGTAELRKICTIGPKFYPVMNKPARSRPFATFCPDPEPHTMTGRSWFDRTADMQLIKSALARGLLDSLSMSIFPRVAYLEGQVSVADIMNNDVGAPIRERVTGAARPFQHDFVGREALPVLAYMDEQMTRRTGQDKGVVGLDADALQSTTKDGVTAAIASSQAQAELISRVFAEGTLKPMFRGLLNLYAENQPKKRQVRLLGEWVEIDPRTWGDMDVSVNVALGNSHEEQKVQTLLAIAADQEAQIQTFGPQGPMVSLSMLRDTKARICALRGYPNASDFYKPIPPDWQPPPPPPPPPSPEIIAAQALLEGEKIKAQVRMQELEMKTQQSMLEHDLKLQQIAAEMELKRIEMELRYNTEINKASLDAKVKQNKSELDNATKLAIADEKNAMEREKLEHDATLETVKTAHDVEMADRKADSDEKNAERKAAIDEKKAEATAKAKKEPKKK